MITEIDGKFYCRTCKNPITVFSENGGRGIRARCKVCKKTSYFPACEHCQQALWKHDEDKCLSARADKMGLRYCRKCKTIKERTEFNIKNGILSSRCKSCQAEYFKGWYEGTRKKSDNDIFGRDPLDDIFGEI